MRVCVCVVLCVSLHHVLSSPEMNMESSRSHLIIGIVIESTNLATGTVVKGKVIAIIIIQLHWSHDTFSSVELG